MCVVVVSLVSGQTNREHGSLPPFGYRHGSLWERAMPAKAISASTHFGEIGRNSGLPALKAPRFYAQYPGCA